MIKCPECGKEVSDQSKNCVHCGFPLKGKNHNENIGGAACIMAVGLAAFLSLLCFPFAVAGNYSHVELSFWQTISFIGERNDHYFSSFLFMGVFLAVIAGILVDIIILLSAISAKSQADLENQLKRFYKLSAMVENLIFTDGFIILGTIIGFDDLLPAAGWYLCLFLCGIWCSIKLRFALQHRRNGYFLSPPSTISSNTNRKRTCSACGYVGTEEKCPQCGGSHWYVQDSTAIPSKTCDYCKEKVFHLTDVAVGEWNNARAIHLCEKCVKKYDIRETFCTDFDPTGINEELLSNEQKEAIFQLTNRELKNHLSDTDYTLEHRCQCYRELQKRGMIRVK